MKKILPLTIVFVAIVIIQSCRNTGTDVSTLIPLVNCDGLITDTLGTNDNARIYMPSAFTCNGDGKNDVIKPTITNATSISYTLYNSNNGIVFTTNQMNQGWSAPSIPSNSYSVYYYKIQITTSAGRKIGMCGEVYNLTCYPAAIPSSKIYFEDQLRPNGFTGVTTEVLPNCQ
jgi:CHU_C Type IX secretion signal domain